jgi:hypothetical protein
MKLLNEERFFMRTITYFQGGTVADFKVPDDRFDDFAKSIDWQARYSEEQLHKARKVLAAALNRDGETAEEILAACFVWNYFNTHPEEEKHISGDVLIIDLEGDGENIDFAAKADVELVREQ